MIVVSDTTPLIALARIDRLALLEQLFGHILIPKAVADELRAGAGRAGTALVNEYEWIEVREVQQRKSVQQWRTRLDRGEAEALVLAGEIAATLVLADEHRARRELRKLGLEVLGTVGILLRSKQAGLIGSIGPEVERLRTVGFRMSERLIQQVLRAAGE